MPAPYVGSSGRGAGCSTGALLGGAGTSQARHPNKGAGRPQTALFARTGESGPVRRAAQARVLRCRVVPGETRRLRAWPIVLGTLLALSSLVPGTVAADSASGIRERASQLSLQNADLAGRSRS